MAENKYTLKGFCWMELQSTDEAKAKAFYTALFDWGTHEMGMEGQPPYTVWMNGEAGIGGLCAAMQGQSRSQWLPYVYVEDADACAERAKKAGGQVLFGPADIPGTGRFAMLQDPEGAQFACIRLDGENHGGIPPLHSHCWSEINCKDAAAAKAFYTEVIGWTTSEQDMGEMGTYTMFHAGEAAVGGMIQMTAEWGETPAHWMSYFTVADCDAAVKKAQGLGAELCHPAMDIPGVGRMAVLTDPAGAVFSVIRMAENQ